MHWIISSHTIYPAPAFLGIIHESVMIHIAKCSGTSLYLHVNVMFPAPAAALLCDTVQTQLFSSTRDVPGDAPLVIPSLENNIGQNSKLAVKGNL